MKTLVAVPCMDMVHADFLQSCVGLEKTGEVQFTMARSSLVYDARNALANVAIEEGWERVLWVDSDMVFDPYLFLRLSEHLDLGREFISGLYFSRKLPLTPVIYDSLTIEPGERFPTPKAHSFIDYPKDDVFRIAGCGFGAVMMTTDLLRRTRDAYGLPFAPASGFGEDLSFCLRATELGATLWCDSSIKLGHAGLAIYNEESFRAARRESEELK